MDIVGIPASADGIERCPKKGADTTRLRRAFDELYGPIWRYLMRLGLREADADDGAQATFMVFSRRLGDVEAGKERAFLYATASRVASDARRRRIRQAEVAEEHAPEPSTCGHEELERQRARRMLHEILGEMDDESREVFVLFELEQFSRTEIATALKMPAGTVASRLRKARALFEKLVKRRTNEPNGSDPTEPPQRPSPRPKLRVVGGTAS